MKSAEGGLPVSELRREHGMNDASFYKWRAKFGGMVGLGHRYQAIIAAIAHYRV